MNCSKCDGSGFLPFIKDGKVIPNVRLFCSCHEDDHEYIPPLKPEDFDFAMSYDFRSFIEESITGKPLPSIIPSEREPEILPRIPPEHKLYGELQQTKGQLLHLQGKLNEHLDKKKRYLYK